MPRYRYTGETRVRIPDAFAEVDPGEEFDSPVELANQYLVPVDAKKRAPAPAPAPAEEARA